LSPTPEVLLAILTDLGTDHRCFKLAESLRRLGVRPVIYCDRPSRAPGPAWAGIEIRVLTRESHQRRFLPVFLSFLFHLTPVLWRTRAEVWISLDAPPLFWLALWGKLRRREVVYDSHELFLETPLVLNRPSRRVFWWLWEGGGFALIRKAVTVSPAILERLRRRHPRVDFYLLPNMPFLSPGVPGDRPPPSRETRLVFQGGLRTATGLPELFTAMKTLPELRLDVYGAGSESGRLAEAARGAEVGERVVFHGAVPFERLPDLLRGAHVGIHLMQPVCGSFALTWANKIFDYVHELLPVLLSDNPAHRELLREFRIGVAVDSFSPGAIARGLEGLLDDYENFAAECRRAREHWHWEACAKGLPAFLGL
jgi:glycosyltransferase involved in cell wall biosynthesis